jgi:CRP-like cAMP-binding protein
MEVADLLRETPLFRDLSEADIELVAQSTRVQNYKSGQTIVREGHAGAAFFILFSGRVQVIKRKAGSAEEVVATLGAGEFFGEFATMKHKHRWASVHAVEETVCLVIWRTDFESFIQQFPVVAARVKSTLAVRYAEDGLSEG